MSYHHIPTAEIEHDIADTEREIATMEREVTAFRLLGDRLSHFKADARTDGILQRRQFVTKLRALLAERNGGAR